MDEQTNSVEYLQNINFSEFQLSAKLAIKSLGRLTPDLDIKQPSKSRLTTYFRKFNSDIYKKHDWLTGCSKKNALFCFPCILFGDDFLWTKVGIVDMKHLSDKMKKHEISRDHLKSVCNLGILGLIGAKTQLSETRKREIDKHNECVRKNRNILSKIIDCVKFCGKFELPMRGHDESKDSINQGIFHGLLEHSQILDESLRNHFLTSSVFKGSSKIIQNEILDCILDVCREEICVEIKKATYLAIMVDDTTDVSEHCQQVIVFRYELGGKVFERFWGFFNPENQDVESLAKCIIGQLQVVLDDNNDKLIAQTYDGASVISGEKGGVQTILKETFKNAHFIHCYAHQLNLVVQKAASRNSQARIFFSNLAGIPEYFSKSSSRLNALDEVSGRIPRGSNTRLNFNIRLVKTVFENKDALVECFKKLETNKNTATIQGASGLLRTLNDENFNFWLNFFHEIMPHIDILYNQLEHRDGDSVIIHSAVERFVQTMQKKRDNLPSIDDTENSQLPKKAKFCPRNNIIAAKEVCEFIISQIEERFRFTHHLSAAKLFLPFISESYKCHSFQLESIVKAYLMLDSSRLYTELNVLRKLPEFKNLGSVSKLFDLFNTAGIGNSLTESYNLLKIIMTTPMTTAEPERCFPTLKRIKTFLRNSMDENRLTALAMISIEKVMIEEIPDFNAKVIEKFVQLKERRLKFNFK